MTDSEPTTPTAGRPAAKKAPAAGQASSEPDVAQASSKADAELRELREAVLDDWLVVTTSVTGALHDIQQTVSWKVTRPLRLGRLLQRKVSEVGAVPASQLAAAALARRLGR